MGNGKGFGGWCIAAVVRAKRKGDGPKAQNRIATVRLGPEVDAALRALADRAGIARWRRWRASWTRA